MTTSPHYPWLVKPTNLGMTFNDANESLDELAVIDCCGPHEKKYTYKDIDRMSNDRAFFLKSKGYGVGDRIAIIARNSTEFLTTLYGIYRIGAVAVPLNYKAGIDDINHMLTDSNS